MSVNAYDIMSVLYICVCLTRFVGRSDCAMPTAIIVSGNNAVVIQFKVLCSTLQPCTAVCIMQVILVVNSAYAMWQ